MIIPIDSKDIKINFVEKHKKRVFTNVNRTKL